MVISSPVLMVPLDMLYGIVVGVYARGANNLVIYCLLGDRHYRWRIVIKAGWGLASMG